MNCDGLGSTRLLSWGEQFNNGHLYRAYNTNTKYLSSSSRQINKNSFLDAHLGTFRLAGSLEDGGGATVSEDGVQDSVVDVVVEGRVYRRQLHADHQRVLSGIRLGQARGGSGDRVEIRARELTLP